METTTSTSVEKTTSEPAATTPVPQSLEHALEIAAREGGLRLTFCDGHGRKYISGFYVDPSDKTVGLVVWGYSKGGGSRVVATSKGNRRIRGRRFRIGWGPKKAQAAADRLNEAAAAWHAAHPKRK